MIKKAKKWISFSLVLTYICLSHVSAMPLAAVDGGQKAGLENAGSQPGFVESSGQKPAPAEKKSILPYLLIGVGTAVVAAVLFFVVFKVKYDIPGYWTGSETFGNSPPYVRWYKFSGDRKSGKVETINPATFSVIATAPYAVDGKKITWSNYNYHYSGAFDSAATINGDIFMHAGNKSGIFALSKSSSDLVARPRPQACNIVGTWIFEFNRRGTMKMTIDFSGDKTNGEFKAKESAWMTGTYTVVNADVTMLTTDKPDVNFSGRFTAENTMAGGWSYMSEYWTWTAHRHE